LKSQSGHTEVVSDEFSRNRFENQNLVSHPVPFGFVESLFLMNLTSFERALVEATILLPECISKEKFAYPYLYFLKSHLNGHRDLQIGTENAIHNCVIKFPGLVYTEITKVPVNYL
jgi:hypothetical protein